MRILIADDHDLLRDTLALFLESQGIAAVAARDVPSALAALDADGPFDLVVLDVNMPGMSGLSGLKTVMERHEGIKVALISGVAPREVAEEALALGAAGFLPKTLPAKSLANALRFMAMGEQYAPLDFMTSAGDEGAAHPLVEKLTKRELDVLKGLCSGLSNKEIARNLELMEPTVKLHVKTLYRKIGVANRTQAAILAKEAGLF